MATSAIPQLPQVVGLTGSELMEAVQSGKSVRVTTAQLAQLSATLEPTGPTGVLAVSLASGENDNADPAGAGPTVGWYECTPLGACTITGWLPGFNGQIATWTNLTAFQMTFVPLGTNSASTWQFRMAAQITLPQYGSKTFKYSTTIGHWIELL